MNKILNTLNKNQSAFRHMAVCAVVMGLGSVAATVTDFFWVLGDMGLLGLNYHIFIMFSLFVANSIILISFLWLVKALYVYTSNHDAKVAKKRASTAKISKQSTIIIHLNQRIDELEAKLGDK